MKSLLGIAVIACAVCGSAFAQAPTTQPLVSANSFTFQLEDVSAREAFEKLAAEAHLTLDPFSRQAFMGKDGVRINALFDHAPFWNVFSELAKETSSVPLWWDNGTMAIVQDGGTWLRQPAVVVGPLRISMQSGTSRHTLLISRAPTQENSAFLILYIANEPHSPVVYFSEFKVLSASDRQGKVIKAELPAHPNVQGFSRGRATVFIHLGEPTDDIKGVGALKVTFNAAVAKFQTVEIPNIRDANKFTREKGRMPLDSSRSRRNAA